MSNPKTPTLTIQISQQSLNLVRQIIAGAGWAKSVEDIYIGGMMLSDDGLPEVAPTDWVKTSDEIKVMSPEEKLDYLKADKNWADTQITLTVTDKQVKVFTKAFEHFCAGGTLAPNRFFNEIITAFGLKVNTD